MGIQGEHSQRFTIDSYLMLNTYQKQNLTFEIFYQNKLISDRKQDCVLLYLDKIKVVGKAICRGICKKCGKEMQGVVSRIKKSIKTNLI